MTQPEPQLQNAPPSHEGLTPPPSFDALRDFLRTLATRRNQPALSFAHDEENAVPYQPGQAGQAAARFAARWTGEADPPHTGFSLAGPNEQRGYAFSRPHGDLFLARTRSPLHGAQETGNGLLLPDPDTLFAFLRWLERVAEDPRVLPQPAPILPAPSRPDLVYAPPAPPVRSELPVANRQTVSAEQAARSFVLPPTSPPATPGNGLPPRPIEPDHSPLVVPQPGDNKPKKRAAIFEPIPGNSQKATHHALAVNNRRSEGASERAFVSAEEAAQASHGRMVVRGKNLVSGEGEGDIIAGPARSPRDIISRAHAAPVSSTGQAMTPATMPSLALETIGRNLLLTDALLVAHHMGRDGGMVGANAQAGAMFASPLGGPLPFVPAPVPSSPPTGNLPGFPNAPIPNRNVVTSPALNAVPRVAGVGSIAAKAAGIASRVMGGLFGSAPSSGENVSSGSVGSVGSVIQKAIQTKNARSFVPAPVGADTGSASVESPEMPLGFPAVPPVSYLGVASPAPTPASFGSAPDGSPVSQTINPAEQPGGISNIDPDLPGRPAMPASAPAMPEGGRAVPVPVTPASKRQLIRSNILAKVSPFLSPGQAGVVQAIRRDTTPGEDEGGLALTRLRMPVVPPFAPTAPLYPALSPNADGQAPSNAPVAEASEAGALARMSPMLAMQVNTQPGTQANEQFSGQNGGSGLPVAKQTAGQITPLRITFAESFTQGPPEAKAQKGEAPLATGGVSRAAKSEAQTAPDKSGTKTPVRPVAPDKQLDPLMGQITLIAPPLQVASRDAEQSGAVMQMDWATLARGSGSLTPGGFAALQRALPPGAQAIYPALPAGSLGANGVNLAVSAPLLSELLSRGYGPHAANMASEAATRGYAEAGQSQASPLPARIMPTVERPIASTGGPLAASIPAGLDTTSEQAKAATGALHEAGSGDSKRGGTLDFMGMPVRLAPSLGGRSELTRETRARTAGLEGASGPAPSSTAPVRPEQFAPLRDRLFPAFQSVQSEPDKGAWRKAAPSLGMPDGDPTTVLSPDARVPRLSAAAPLPSLPSMGEPTTGSTQGATIVAAPSMPLVAPSFGAGASVPSSLPSANEAGSLSHQIAARYGTGDASSANNAGSRESEGGSVIPVASHLPAPLMASPAFVSPGMGAVPITNTVPMGLLAGGSIAPAAPSVVQTAGSLGSSSPSSPSSGRSLKTSRFSPATSHSSSSPASSAPSPSLASSGDYDNAPPSTPTLSVSPVRAFTPLTARAPLATSVASAPVASPRSSGNGAGETWPSAVSAPLASAPISAPTDYDSRPLSHSLTLSTTSASGSGLRRLGANRPMLQRTAKGQGPQAGHAPTSAGETAPPAKPGQDTASEVNLLAGEVYDLLKRRLRAETERAGRW